MRFMIAWFATTLVAGLAGCTGEGADGSSCTVEQNNDGSATITCDDGTTATVKGGVDGVDGDPGADGADGTDCSVVDNGNGTSTIECTDGTQVTVSNSSRPPGSAVATFEEIPYPTTDAAKRLAEASPSVKVNGTDYSIAFNTVLRSGDDPASDGNKFGLIVDEDGDPVLNADGSEFISNSNDFSSLLPVGDKLFAVTHFESRPGAYYLSEFSQDEATGALTAVSTEPIDMSGVDGIWVPCAGSVTPWGTHLGGEEYPPNARAWEDLDDGASAEVVGGYTLPMFRYYGIDIYTDADSSGEIDATVGDVRAVWHPYFHGYPNEVVVDENGDVEVTKHYTMGRAAIELAYVMPDQRTAYITDDGTNVGLFMFVADEAGDLSSGRLYAMKWNQVSSFGGGRADIEWIPLHDGSVSNEDMQAYLDLGIEFSDIFEVGSSNADGTCDQTALDAGFKTVMRTSLSGQTECLKLNDGMSDAASRFETTRYAAYVGATTELRKEEGVTFDFSTDTLYVAMSAVERGMEGGETVGPDHVRLPENDCGVVYALPTGAYPGIDSRYVAQRWIGVVAGKPSTDESCTVDCCDIDGISNPDNVTFMDGYGILIIGEDTGNSGHQNDLIWAYDVYTGEMTRIQTTPYGSETTSPYWYGDINGWSYLRSVIQHPYGESDQDKLSDPADARGYDAYVGPMPALQ